MSIPLPQDATKASTARLDPRYRRHFFSLLSSSTGGLFQHGRPPFDTTTKFSYVPNYDRITLVTKMFFTKPVFGNTLVSFDHGRFLYVRVAGENGRS
jgi:hypothetical protein